MISFDPASTLHLPFFTISVSDLDTAALFKGAVKKTKIYNFVRRREEEKKKTKKQEKGLRSFKPWILLYLVLEYSVSYYLKKERRFFSSKCTFLTLCFFIPTAKGSIWMS